MTVNPTEAKEIAIYFLEKTNQKIVPMQLARIIKSVKEVMEAGFSNEEILYSIDYTLMNKSNVWSFSYVAMAINDIIRKRNETIKKEQDKKLKKEIQSKQEESLSPTKRGVTQDDASRRNEQKARDIGNIQSRVREKSYFNMFEGQ